MQDPDQILEGVASLLHEIELHGPYDDGSFRISTLDAREGPVLLSASEAAYRDAQVTLLRDGERVKVVIEMELEPPETST